MKPVLIAELAKNHLGNESVAKRLIDDAKKSGFNAVKFQAYNIEDIKQDHPNYERYVKCHLTINQLKELKKYANKSELDFFCSVFSYNLIDPLREFTDKIKIPSTFFNVAYFVTKCLETFPEVHMSTGMNDLAAIRLQYSDYFSKLYIKKESPEIILYHCVSEYPTPPEHSKMCRVGGGHFRGYSDHTSGIDAMLIATLRGAKYIEKHFSTLSDSKKWEADIIEMQDYHEKASHFLRYMSDNGMSPTEIQNFNFFRKEFRDLSLLEDKNGN